MYRARLGVAAVKWRGRNRGRRAGSRHRRRMPFMADDARTISQTFVTPKLEKAGSSGMLLVSARLTRSPRHGVICPSSDAQGPHNGMASIVPPSPAAAGGSRQIPPPRSSSSRNLTIPQNCFGTGKPQVKNQRIEKGPKAAHTGFCRRHDDDAQ